MDRRLVFLVLALVLLGGCSQLGRQWSNFAAYHNTFYNARLSFEEGVRAVEEPEPGIERGSYLPVFGALRSVSDPEPFEEAIRRSADVLRKHPNSRWVEEALLIIGRSYLYLENHVGAEQKFHELIALESSYTEEAYYWLGRTLVEAEKYDEAVRIMEEALERESLSRTWMGRYYLVAGRARIEEGAFEEAADLLERGARAVPERRLETRAWFLVGQVQETLGRYPEAIAAYERAETRTFDVDLAYEAAVSRVRSMTSAGGQHGEALRILNLLQRQPAYEHKQAELSFLEAKVSLSQGNTEEAQERFRALLRTEGSVPRDVEGRIHYTLAEMYSSRDDLMSAAAHYDSAAAAGGTSSRQQPGSRVFGQGVLQDLEQRRNAYQAYATAQEQVEHLDSLLHLGTLPQEEFDQFVLDLQQRRLEEQQDNQEERSASSSSSSWETSYEDDELLEEAAELDVSDTEPGSAGFLFYRDRSRVQDGQIAFVQRWGDRPLTPNWRRRAAARLMGTPEVRGQETLNMVQEEGRQDLAESGEQPAVANALPEVDVSEVPRDEQARAEMMERRTRLQFEAANALFLQLNRPDSAAAIYETILRENPDRDIAVRAHYALAETQRMLGNTDRSEALYRELAERYPESEFASRAREMVGEEVTTPAAPEADLDAELQFQEAMARWDQGDAAYALGSMLVLAEHHRDTGLAPRALYAVTRIFRDWADRNGYHELPPLSAVLPAPVIEAAGFALSGDPAEESEERSLVSDGLVIGMRFIDAPPSGPGLADIYRRLVERYPDTEQAERAEQLLALLDPASEDEGPEGIAAVEEEHLEDNEENAGDREDDILPGPEDGTFRRTIDWEAGRWTIVIVSWPQIEHAQRSASTFRGRLADEDVDVDILVRENESGDRRYYVGVGQFSTETEAQGVLETLQGRLPDQARVEQVREQDEAI